MAIRKYAYGICQETASTVALLMDIEKVIVGHYFFRTEHQGL